MNHREKKIDRAICQNLNDVLEDQRKIRWRRIEEKKINMKDLLIEFDSLESVDEMMMINKFKKKIGLGSREMKEKKV